MIQAVQNGKRFAVERDIVQLFPAIAMSAANAMARTAMPPAVRDFAAATGVTDLDTVKAATCLAEFINITNSRAFAGDDLPAAYIRSGLDRVPQAAQVALYSTLGMALVNAYFVHTRNALPTDVAVPGLDQMTEIISRSAHAVAGSDPAARQRRIVDTLKATEKAIEEL